MYVYTYAHKSYYHLQDAKILKINGIQPSYLIISFHTFMHTRDWPPSSIRESEIIDRYGDCKWKIEQ